MGLLDKAKDFADDVKDKLTGGADDAADSASEQAGEASAEGGSFLDGLKEKAGDLADKLPLPSGPSEQRHAAGIVEAG